MADEHKQLSLDDQAAELAATMNFSGAGAPLEKGGAAGDMPQGQTGAEGGFTDDAGGQVITAGVPGAVAKGGQTGAQVTNEPGPQNQNPKTGAAMTGEPRGEGGGGAGTGGNLSQEGDASTRARKPGQVGVSGGSTGGGMPESQDDQIRGRKAGKVGISKAEAIQMGLTAEQFQALATKGLVKADGEEDEEEGDEMEAGKACKKGGEIETADLMKSLHTLEAVAAGSAIPATVDRRAELAKGLEAGTLTQDEMVELADLMKASVDDLEDIEAVEPLEPLQKGGDELEDDLEVLEAMEKSYQEQFADAEADEGTYDVSPFLERLHQQTAAALDQIQGNLMKAMGSQGSNQRNFNVQLAKSLQGMAQLATDQGELIKSLAQRLEVVENQPMPRRGVTNLQQLQKSIPNEAGGGGNGLDRNQILDALEKMAMRMEVAPCGERLDRAVAMYETSGQLSKSLYQDVSGWIQNNSGMVQVH